MAENASAARYYTVAPCRLIDTRTSADAPALSGNATRIFTVAGRCQTSPTADSVAANVTVTQPSAAGYLTLFAGGTSRPLVSTINFRANQTRANSSILKPGLGGSMNVFTGISAGNAHLIVDVVGYFDNPANNQPPQISAGANQTITLPANANLSGTATDDGKPNPPATLTRTWSKQSGPGNVTFGTPSALATSASFSAAGTYVIRLSVSDSQYTTTDELTIVVNPLGGTSLGIARFLEQATFGPTDPLISYVQSRGVVSWLNEQFNAPPSGFPPMPMVPANATMQCQATLNCTRDNYSMYLLQRRFFENALYANDQLRQKVAWTLHKLIVVSGVDITVPWWMQVYLDILQRNAFGNYRQLLYEITLNPAMGNYLDMITSTRVNPNENFAREILQLFAIGTVMLNQDGTPQVDGAGVPLPTYDQAIVEGFAKVFTGWTFGVQPVPGVTNYRDPMRLIANNHDTVNEKLVLPPTSAGVGITDCSDFRAACLSPGQSGDIDLNQAIDNIFYHQNVAPYVAKHFIQHLVTSNPTPAYVGRVAAVFNNNGSGIRGDLRAVVEATLLDPEASAAPSTQFGKLKEPVLRATQFLRAMNVMSANRSQPSDGYINQLITNQDQDALRPPSVFSYYPAEFIAPGTALAGAEFGIYSAVGAFRTANLFNTLIYGFNGTAAGVGVNATIATGLAPAGTSIDLAPLQGLAASNPSGLCDELSRRLMHGTMSASMKNAILTAVAAVPATNPLQRAQTALYLVATSSQYHIAR